MNLWSLLLPFKWFIIGVGEVGIGIINIIKIIITFVGSLFKYLFKVVIIIGRGIFFFFKVVVFKYIILNLFNAIKYLIIGLLKVIKFISVGLFKFIRFIIENTLRGIVISSKYIFLGFKYLFIYLYKALNAIFKFLKKITMYFLEFLKWLFVDIIFKFIRFIGISLFNGFVVILKFLAKIPCYLYNALKFVGNKLYKAIINPIIIGTKKVALAIKSLFETIKGYVKRFFALLKRIPGVIARRYKKWFNNLTFVKDAKNKKEMKHQALLIDFDADDSVRSEKKVMYDYIAKNSKGKIEKGYLAAYSKLDVHSYLLSEGYEVYQIEVSKGIKLSFRIKHKMKVSELTFFLTQLSTYLKSGIPLVDSIKILSKQTKKISTNSLYKAIIYDLTMGDNFSEALEKQGDSFPKLLINMIKSAELAGNLSETLDDMAEYYTSVAKTRKQMKSAMTYPAVIFVFATTVIVFLLTFVIPSFVDMYKDADAEVPGLTVAIIAISDFLINNAVLLLIGVVGVIVGFVFMYKNVKLFKSIVQWLLMHTPIVGKIIIYNEVTMFSKTFASLWNHNVFITSSMEILSKITNNEIYKMLIFDAITNIARGEPVSSSFKDHWAFPVVAYEMLLTGERTGQPGPMMDKVAEYYQEEHRNAVNQVKTFIEPALIVFLAVVVGIILLSVVLPMFGIYGEIGLE